MTDMRLGRVLVWIPMALVLFVKECTSEPSGAGRKAPPVRAQVVSGTVLAVKVHDAIIYVAAATPAPNANTAGAADPVSACRRHPLHIGQSGDDPLTSKQGGRQPQAPSEVDRLTSTLMRLDEAA
jgi:hypothetical protein